MRETVEQRILFLSAVMTLITCGWTIGATPAQYRIRTPASKVISDSSATGFEAHATGRQLMVELVGQDLHWTVRFPGPDQILHTPDDLTTSGPIHLPSESPVTIRLSSQDFMYSFGLPSLRLKQIAVPELTFELQLQPLNPGELEYVGDQFCGGNHSQLGGRIVIESTAEFNRWLNSLATD